MLINLPEPCINCDNSDLDPSFTSLECTINKDMSDPNCPFFKKKEIDLVFSRCIKCKSSTKDDENCNKCMADWLDDEDY